MCSAQYKLHSWYLVPINNVCTITTCFDVIVSHSHLVFSPKNP